MTALRSFRPPAVLLVLLLGTACADSSEPALDGGEPSAEVAAPALQGGYRFARLNEQLPPVEFPAGSGSMIETGTLDLDPSGMFELRFITGGPLGSEPSQVAGSYRVVADTLFFTPADSGNVPQTFQYELNATGLRLRDADQNVWSYARRPETRG